MENPFETLDNQLKTIESLLIEIKDYVLPNMQPHPEQILSREQTAQLLHIDKSTLWHWTKKKKIKAYGIV